MSDLKHRRNKRILTALIGSFVILVILSIISEALFPYEIVSFIVDNEQNYLWGSLIDSLIGLILLILIMTTCFFAGFMMSEKGDKENAQE